ncbi:cytochrome P450 [Marasmius fiardii PR-910]|nr:cytochrome P450 [Marasmius fiardii PR-910]
MLALFVVILIPIGTSYLLLRRSRLKVPYPPGPKGLPFVGNLFQIPLSKQWVKFFEWAKEYGPIFHLKAGPQHIVVLNTPDAVEDLFINKNKVFSDRLVPYVAANIVSDGQRIIYLQNDSQELKVLQKVHHQALSNSSAKAYRPMQELESTVLLYDLLRDGEDKHSLVDTKTRPEERWIDHIHRFALSISRYIIYGEHAKTFDDPVIEAIYTSVRDVTSISLPGAFLADTFPFLRMLPDLLSPWRTRAKELQKKHFDNYMSYVDRVRSDLRNDVPRPSNMVGNYLTARAEAGVGSTATYELPGKGVTEDGWMRDKMLAMGSGAILEAGAETTASTICTFLLVMLGNREAMRKAQDELDNVVGRDRLPTFEDELRLPYVVACIKESLRCKPMVPLAIPHAASEDTIYKGYLIPKGTAVFGNVWALHMDEVRFPNPDQFKPERWLTVEEEKPLRYRPVRFRAGPERDRDLYTFGWGRRFCTGSYVAEATLFIALSRILWAFEFEFPEGVSVDWRNEESYSGDLVPVPKAFPVSFRPRSKKHAEVVGSGVEGWR